VRKIWPLLILGLVTILFFWKIFFLGEIFSPADLLLERYPWKAVAPENFTHPSNVLRVDEVELYYPGRVNLVKDFKENGLYFWRPYYLSGLPGGATLFLYPLSWVFFFLPTALANSLFHILIILTGGVFMYLFLTTLSLSIPASLMGAIAYMLNGYFIVWLSAATLPAVFTLLPLILFLWEKFSKTKNYFFLWLSVIVLAIQFFLGYPPALIINCFILLLYLVFKCISSPFKTGLLCGLSVILAIFLAAFTLLPGITQLLQSSSIAARQQAINFLPLSNLITFLLPNFWGNPAKYVWYGPSNYCGLISYFGITILPLIPIGILALKNKKPLLGFLLTILTISLSVAYGIPPFSFITKIFGFKQIAATYWQIGIVFSGILFASFGFHFLTANIQTKKRKKVILSTLLISSIILLILFLVFVFNHGKPNLPAIYRLDLYRPHWRDLFYDGLYMATSFFWQTFLFLSSFILLILFLFKKLKKTFFIILFLALVTLDLFTFGVGFNPTIKPQYFYPVTPGIKFLQEDKDLFRILPLHHLSTFSGHTANIYGLNIINGFSLPQDEEYINFFKPILGEKGVQHSLESGWLYFDSFTQTNQNLFSLLNTKYIVDAPIPQKDPPPTWLEEVYRGEDLVIYKNIKNLPRAWEVSNYKLFDNENDLLTYLSSEKFDPRKEGLFLKDDFESPSGFQETTDDSSEVRILDYRNNQIVLETNSHNPRFLILSEKHYPNWQVKIDNQESKILRVNYLLRAVPLAAGKHTVHFYYQPHFKIGTKISFFTFLIFALSGIFLIFKRSNILG